VQAEIIGTASSTRTERNKAELVFSPLPQQTNINHYSRIAASLPQFNSKIYSIKPLVTVLCEEFGQALGMAKSAAPAAVSGQAPPV